MGNTFKVALTTVLLIFSFVSYAANELTKDNVTDYAAMIDFCEAKGHVSKGDMKELLFPRTRMWVHENLSGEEKNKLQGVINSKKNEITSVNKKGCDFAFNELMKLPTPFKLPFLPVPESELTGEEIKEEKKLISSACPNFISAAIESIKVGKNIEQKGNATINDFHKVVKTTELYSNKINVVVTKLEQENKLKYLFTSERSIRDYQKYSSRKLVDRLQGDKLAFIQNSMDLSFVACKQLGFKF